MENSSKHIGVIGGGSFGTAIANLLAKHNRVQLLVRSESRITNINEKKFNANQPVLDNIKATQDIQSFCKNCTLIFPMVPSTSFRPMIRGLADHLRPHHILIHGTKGVDVVLLPGEDINSLKTIRPNQINTMSEVITQETSVARIGCLAGPNLVGELKQKQPAGAVIASPFEEVIRLGSNALKSERFKIFESNDLLGAELAGVLKNVFAIASGILGGLGFGNNARALLITKGLHEMLYIGSQLGSDTTAFLGIAGIGDLIATCSSDLSRNYSVGKRLAQGEKLDDILQNIEEVAEGVRSIKIFHLLCKSREINAPITDVLHKVLYEDYDALEAVTLLMKYNFPSDVTFM